MPCAPGPRMAQRGRSGECGRGLSCGNDACGVRAAVGVRAWRARLRFIACGANVQKTRLGTQLRDRLLTAHALPRHSPVPCRRHSICAPSIPAARPEGLGLPHWYPTQLTLSDDRVLFVGGYASEADPPVPAVEVWDARVRRVTTITPEPFLLQLGACGGRRGDWGHRLQGAGGGEPPIANQRRAKSARGGSPD
jgi:hypothetical protein